MGYRIGKVTYTNFGPFEQAELDFSAPGLTVVEGQIEGLVGSDSNGAGKSFLFDGVAWCLYGRCIRPDYTGDNIQRHGSRGTAVVVELVGGPNPVTVERYRQHPQWGNQARILVNGKEVTRGTDAQTTLALESMIGMDFTVFCNSVAFATREDVKSFFAASDGDRKKVLDTLLGMELYTEAEKVARRRLKDATSRLDQLKNEREISQARLEEKRQALQAVGSHVDVEVQRIRVGEAALKVKQLQKQAGVLDAQLETLQEEMQASETRFAAVMAEFEAKRAAWDKERQQAAQVWQRADTAFSVAMRAVATLEDEKRRFQKIKAGACPTCKQDVTAKHTAAVTTEYDRKIADAQAVQADAEVKVTTAGKALEEVKAREPKDVPVNDECATLETREQQLREEKARLEGQLPGAKAAYNTAKAALDSEQSKVSGIEAEIAQLERADADRMVAIDQMEQTVAENAFWAEAFGNRGLKSFLIEAEIPAINRYATVYARRLLGSGATVRLAATTRLKSQDATREKLTVEGTIPGYTTTYKGASKGQKRRMDLALLLAFRELVASRSVKAFDQLFADEVFDGLDRSGAEAVSELLREISRTCPVVLVTHENSLKCVGDRRVIVHHVNGQATLELRHAATTFAATSVSTDASHRKPARRAVRAG